MGEVIYGIDFAKRKEDETKAAFDSVQRALILLAEQLGPLIVIDDTAPCEYVAPEQDPA